MIYNRKGKDYDDVFVKYKYSTWANWWFIHQIFIKLYSVVTK